MSAAIFYLGFICGAYPAIVLAQRFPIERVIFGIVFLWGACLMCTAGCFNYQSLYAQRFFLGMLESGVSPAWMLVVGGWYKKREQAMRMGVRISSHIPKRDGTALTTCTCEHADLVFLDWIRLHGISANQLRPGSHFGIPESLAIHVHRSGSCHGHLELRDTGPNATRPGTGEALH